MTAVALFICLAQIGFSLAGNNILIQLYVSLCSTMQHLLACVIYLALFDACKPILSIRCYILLCMSNDYIAKLSFVSDLPKLFINSMVFTQYLHSSMLIELFSLRSAALKPMTVHTVEYLCKIYAYAMELFPLCRLLWVFMLSI